MLMSIRSDTHTVKVLGGIKRNELNTNKAVENLSTGLKVKRAADDASGFAIAFRMRVRVRAFEQDMRNAQNGISMLKTANTAVDNTIGIIRTLKEKALDAANDTNTDSDRNVIQKELDKLIEQIDDNAMTTYNDKYLLMGTMGNRPDVNFNFCDGVADTKHKGKNLMDTITELGDKSDYDFYGNAKKGSAASSADSTDSESSDDDYPEISMEDFVTDYTKNYMRNYETNTNGDIAEDLAAELPEDGEYLEETPLYDFSDYTLSNVSDLQVGTRANVTTTVRLRDMTARSLGLMDGQRNTLQVTTREKASESLEYIDRALQYALGEQTALGVAMNRLEASKETLTVNIENTTNSKATITDVDMAKEMISYTTSNILSKASSSMLSQANHAHENALFLLQ